MFLYFAQLFFSNGNFFFSLNDAKDNTLLICCSIFLTYQHKDSVDVMLNLCLCSLCFFRMIIGVVAGLLFGRPAYYLSLLWCCAAIFVFMVSSSLLRFLKNIFILIDRFPVYKKMSVLCQPELEITW